MLKGKFIELKRDHEIYNELKSLESNGNQFLIAKYRAFEHFYVYCKGSQAKALQGKWSEATGHEEYSCFFREFLTVKDRMIQALEQDWGEKLEVEDEGG